MLYISDMGVKSKYHNSLNICLFYSHDKMAKHEFPPIHIRKGIIALPGILLSLLQICPDFQLFRLRPKFQLLLILLEFAWCVSQNRHYQKTYTANHRKFENLSYRLKKQKKNIYLKTNMLSKH